MATHERPITSVSSSTRLFRNVGYTNYSSQDRQYFNSCTQALAERQQENGHGSTFKECWFSKPLSRSLSPPVFPNPIVMRTTKGSLWRKPYFQTSTPKEFVEEPSQHVSTKIASTLNSTSPQLRERDESLKKTDCLTTPVTKRHSSKEASVNCVVAYESSGEATVDSITSTLHPSGRQVRPSSDTSQIFPSYDIHSYSRTIALPLNISALVNEKHVSSSVYSKNYCPDGPNRNPENLNFSDGDQNKCHHVVDDSVRCLYNHAPLKSLSEGGRYTAPSNVNGFSQNNKNERESHNQVLFSPLNSKAQNHNSKWSHMRPSSCTPSSSMVQMNNIQLSPQSGLSSPMKLPEKQERRFRRSPSTITIHLREKPRKETSVIVRYMGAINDPSQECIQHEPVFSDCRPQKRHRHLEASIRSVARNEEGTYPSFNKRTARSDGLNEYVNSDPVVNTLVQLLLEMKGFKFMGETNRQELRTEPDLVNRMDNGENYKPDDNSNIKQNKPLQKTRKRGEKQQPPSRSPSGLKSCFGTPGEIYQPMCGCGNCCCRTPLPCCHHPDVSIDTPEDREYLTSTRYHELVSHNEDYPGCSDTLAQLYCSRENSCSVGTGGVSGYCKDMQLKQEILLLRERVSKLQDEAERLRKREALTEAALDKMLVVLGHITKGGSSELLSSLGDKLLTLRTLPLANKQLAAQLLNSLVTLDVALRPPHTISNVKEASRLRVLTKHPAEEVAYSSFMSGEDISKTSLLSKRRNKKHSLSNEALIKRHSYSTSNLLSSENVKPFRLENKSMDYPEVLGAFEDVVYHRINDKIKIVSDLLTKKRKLSEEVAKASKKLEVQQLESFPIATCQNRIHPRQSLTTSSGGNASISSSCKQLFASLQDEVEDPICSDAEPGRLSLALSSSADPDRPNEILDSESSSRLVSNSCGSSQSLEDRQLHVIKESPTALSKGKKEKNNDPTSSISNSPVLGYLAIRENKLTQHVPASLSLSPPYFDRKDDDEELISLSCSQVRLPPRNEETKKTRPRVVPPLGLLGVGSGSWMSGQQTSGETSFVVVVMRRMDPDLRSASSTGSPEARTHF